MALGITINPPTGGEVGKIYGTIAFDNSYTTGGMLITALQLGAQRIKRIDIQNEQGYSFEVVYPTLEPLEAYIKVYAGSGGSFSGAALPAHSHNLQLIQEEPITVIADTGTLANLPALVQNVYASAGGSVGTKVIQPTAVVAPVAGQVRVDNSNGSLVFSVADAVTNALVTYLTFPTTSVSAGTPSGSITGGGSAEVANGTNLSALTAVEFVATVFGDV